MLHADARRLFSNNIEGGTGWVPSYDVRYKSRGQAQRHAQRDGTAFASVVLPSHYSVICNVLDHVKRRLGPSWNVEHVIDWGAGTGSGLWCVHRFRSAAARLISGKLSCRASLHCFQENAAASDNPDDLQISKSTLSTYSAIESRDGLSRIGKTLLKGRSYFV